MRVKSTVIMARMIVMSVIVMPGMLFSMIVVMIIMPGLFFGMVVIVVMIMVVMTRLFRSVIVVMIMIVMTGFFLAMLVTVIVMARVILVIIVVVMIVVIIVVVVFVKGDGFQSGRGNDQSAIESRGFRETLQPALELQSVHEEDICLRYRCCGLRRRLIDMRIPVRTDQRDKLDVVATDALHHIAQNRKRGDHRDGFLGEACAGHQDGCRDKRGCGFKKCSA